MTIKLIVGARDTAQDGWISTSLHSKDAPLDIRHIGQWATRFYQASIDNILCEHVLEHLWPEEAEVACQNFYRYLKPGGRVRIAVPDAYNPNVNYQAMCRPGSTGRWLARLLNPAPDEPEHKTHWDFQSLSAMLARVDFQPHLLEYFDASGRFHRNAWDWRDGSIQRCYGSAYNHTFKWWFGYENLSLIVDAIKPAAH